MNLPQFEQGHRQAYPWRSEILAAMRSALVPLWLSWASAGMLCGLVWRCTGFTAPPVLLADCLGAIVWLGALWLVPAWERLDLRQRSLGNAPFQMSNGLATAILLIAAYLLTLAWSGLMLAYPPVAYLIGRPIDTDPVVFSVPRLLVFNFPLVAAPLLLLGVASLSLLRRLMGTVIGSAVWLAMSVVLHHALLSGIPVWDSLLTPGNLLRQLIEQVQSEDPLLSSHMFGPLRFAVQGLWLAAVVLLRLASLPAPPRTRPLPPLALALYTSCLGLALRSWLCGRNWLTDLVVLEPDNVPALSLAFTATALAVWFHLSIAQVRGAQRELQQHYWLFAPAIGTMLLASSAITGSGGSTQAELVASICLTALLLACLLAACLAAARLSGLLAPQQPAMPLAVLFLLLLPFGMVVPWSAAGSPLALLIAAIPTQLAAQPALLAASFGLLCAACLVLVRLSRPRRPGRTAAALFLKGG